MNSLRQATDTLTSLLELAIFLYGLSRWDSLDRARRLLTAWAGSWVVASAVGLILMRASGYSHLAPQLFLPLSALLALGTLAAVQYSRRNRDALRIAAALYAVIWAVVTFTLEDLGDYSLITGPIHHLLVTGASVFTLQSALRRVQGEVMDDSAAVVSIGFLAWAAPTAIVHPMIPVLEGEPMLNVLLTVRNVAAISGYLVLLRALQLPRIIRQTQEAIA